MKIVVDENMPLAEAFFGEVGTVVRLPGRLMSQADLVDADALMVRSVTEVNRELLEGTPVRFVGSATIGMDHIDQTYLDSERICYASAPGCNADAVVNYVVSSLLEIEAARGLDILNSRVGIVGYGNVGSRVYAALEALGLDVVVCDPPLQSQYEQRGNAAEAARFSALEEVLTSDILSFHVPRVLEGPYPTHHMLDREKIMGLPQGACIINTSRGSVIDNQALRSVLQQRSDLSAVLDVWENEPLLDTTLANLVDIATPHIAGYSYDGKVKGTEMIYQAFCRFLGKPADIGVEAVIQPEMEQGIDFKGVASDGVVKARQAVQAVYRIMDDDIGLRSTLKKPADERAAGFDQLRKHYRLRREFSTVTQKHTEWMLDNIEDVELRWLRAAGFCR